uniref:Cadherin-related family member 5 n=1 Tax=Panthera tigris altaica TaxID=74533 RepID=A0A8C9JXP5_PANTA
AGRWRWSWAAGGWREVCSVSNTYFEVPENTNQSEPLADIYVPEGQQVTLGPSSTPLAFRIQGTQLFLNVTPDYEEHTMLQAQLECRRGDTVVTLLRVFVFVLDINDNAPVFPFVTKVENVSEDTKVNTIVVPETKLEAHDPDKSDILFYTLQEVTPGASNFFSLVGTNLPALRLDRSLDFYQCQNMTFQLLVRDTQEQNAAPSHTATATVILEVQPADLRPPWFLPCAYSDSHVCIQAEYHGAVPTGHTLQGPLTLHPGPIYAVDGDWGINQSILYSIVNDGTFAIDADSGNLTMTGAPLRIWAWDPEFPDFDSAITYRITNNTNFRMDGETVVTAALLADEGVFYAEVEATNTVTASGASTVVEIQVLQEEAPTPTGVSHTEDQRFSTVEMAALGGVLGALLVLTLIALLILVHKHYGHRFKCCSGKAQHPQLSGFDNQAFHAPQESNWAPAPSPSPAPTPAVAPEPAPPEPPSLQSLDPASESPEVARDGGGPAAVRSILTKERRPEGGYKAVWFGEDIGAEADVVVLNTPASDAAGAADSGSEDSSDEADAEAEGPGGGSCDDASSTYV